MPTVVQNLTGEKQLSAVGAKSAKAGPVPGFGSVATSELRFIAIFALSLCLLTCVPYLIGYLTRVQDTVFTGVLDHSVDTNNYLAYAEESASGNWLFYNPMTGEPHRAVFFNLEWLTMGKLSSSLHISLALAMNVERVLCLVIMCFAVYWLASLLFSAVLMRRTALVAVMAGGGFGWLASLRGLGIPVHSSYFADLNCALFPFFWELRVPHCLVSSAFVVLGLCFFLRSEHSGKIRGYAFGGLCYMASGMCRPYDMLFLMAATSVYAAVLYVRERSLSTMRLRTRPVWICMPLLGYYLWIFKLHPVFRWWSLPGSPVPAPWIVASGYGASFVLLIFALWNILLRKGRAAIKKPELFMLCCFSMAVLLTYLRPVFPFAFQFATNILVPMIMVVLIGLKEPLQRFWKRSSRARICFVSLLLLNSLTCIAYAGQAAVMARRGDFRIDAKLAEAYSRLNLYARPRDVVFADFDNSNRIPQYAQVSAFCGYSNAVQFAAKVQEQEQFLRPDASQEFRKDLLKKNNVRFVFLTAEEQKNLASFTTEPFLKEVFSNDAAAIYALRQ